MVKNQCPICLTGKMLPGYPSADTMTRANKGEVILGGCIIDGNTHQCGRCGHRAVHRPGKDEEESE